MPEPPPRKRPLWLKCLYFAIAFLFMVSLGLLLYFSTLPPEYDRETMGNIVSHELTYSTSQGTIAKSKNSRPKNKMCH